MIREVTMYWTRLGAALACAVMMTGLLATDAGAQRRDDRGGFGGGRGEWIPLGEKLVSFRGERDVIEIGQSEDWFRTRAFRALHFKAERNDIFMMRVCLVYMNGYGEDFPINTMIRQGTEYPIDLRGERSFLQRIEMFYRSRPDFRGEAVMKVFGEPSRRRPEPGPGPGAGGWVELGCKEVSLFGRDKDSINVGREEGRFKAIRLHVRGTDVEMKRLTVIYGRGEPDDLPTRHFIRAGDRTPPMDLKGYERSIRRVDMVYSSIPNFRRQATVCVEGLQ
jgi:hypothetical protein